MLARPCPLIIVVLVLMAAAPLLSGCADGAPGTPGTATAHLDGSATYFAGVSGSH